MIPAKKDLDEERIKKIIEMMSDKAPMQDLKEEALETPEDEAMESPEEQAEEEENGTEMHDKKGRLFGHPKLQIMIAMGKHRGR